MEERMRILKLLEDGKINAEEAARLLEALKEEERPHKESIIAITKSVSDLLKGISETVSEAVKEKTKQTTEKVREAAEKLKKTAEEVREKTKKG